MKAPEKQTLRECRKTSAVEYTSLLTVFIFSFHLNILKFNSLKFELQYESTPQLIHFCGYRVLQLFCHYVEVVHVIKCSQKQLQRKCCWFLKVKNRFGRSDLILLQSLGTFCNYTFRWHFSSSSQSSWEEFIRYLKDFKDFFYTGVSFIFFENCLFTSRWRKACALIYATYHVIGSETPKHNAFDHIDKTFWNLNSLSNIF